jgi:hypothetical protein
MHLGHNPLKTSPDEDRTDSKRSSREEWGTFYVIRYFQKGPNKLQDDELGGACGAALVV